MKKRFLFLASMLVGSFVFANNGEIQNNHKNIDLATAISPPDHIKYTLNLGDLTNVNEVELAKQVNDFILNNVKDDAELECTVTVTGSVSVGVGSVEISVSVSGPCKEVRAQGTAIANDILNQVKGAIKKLM